MFRCSSLLLISLAFLSCQDNEKDTFDGVACPAIELDCPDGQITCDPDSDADCVMVTLGEEPCTQERYCMTE